MSTGALCQNNDMCWGDRNPCRPGSHCTTDPTEAIAVCSSCPDGYTGPHCYDDIDECNAEHTISPCAHGGQCINTQGSFYCNCPKGFAGNLCDKIINECIPNPCVRNQSHGCIDRIGGFKCTCKDGELIRRVGVFGCELPASASGERPNEKRQSRVCE